SDRQARREHGHAGPPDRADHRHDRALEHAECQRPDPRRPVAVRGARQRRHPRQRRHDPGPAADRGPGRADGRARQRTRAHRGAREEAVKRRRSSTTMTAVMTPPSATEARLGELRQLVQTGRLDWKLPIGDALQRAGLPGGLPAEEWARLAWYGPLETWLRADINAQISDILINGPGRDVMVIDAGQRMPTGL